MKSKLINLKNFIGKNKFIKKIYEKKQGCAAIICYHRVITDEENNKNLRPNGDLSITAKNFEKQICFLKENFKVVAMDELLIDNKDKFKIAITFDDGYLDNFTNALPILTRYNLPATIYITTGFICREAFAWWLELWNLIIEKKIFILKYEKLNLNEDISSYNLKRKLYLELAKYFKNLPHAEHKKIFHILNNNQFKTKFGDFFLNENQLILLANSDLITIGAHTHTHPNLKALSYNDCMFEIKKSKDYLEKILRKKIKHFAYPYGAKEFFSIRESDMLKDMGFSTAVTTLTGQLKKDDNFFLPRIGLNDFHTNNQIQDKLSGWDNFLKKLI